MIVILVVLFALLIKTKLPPWVLFLGALTITMALGLAPMEGSLKGFSNSGVLTVAVLYLVAAGMYSTGAITLIAEKLIGLPKTLRKAQIRILVPVAVGSAFLNNTPLVAMFIPVIRDICRATRLKASKLYLPLSFASILGGASTLIGTSTNLIVAGLVMDQVAKGSGENGTYIRPLNIFDPTLVAVPAAVLGIAFLIVFGSRLLPEPKAKVEEELKRLYGAEFIIREGSHLIGQTVGEAGFAHPVGFELTSITREDGSKPKIDASLGLQAGDILAFTSDTDALPSLWTTIGLTPLNATPSMEEKRHTHRLAEVVVSKRNRAIGRKVSEFASLEYEDTIMVVALSRHGKPPEMSIHEARIEEGDNLILEAEDSFFYEHRTEREFSLAKRLRGYRIKRTRRAFAAILITAAMVTVAALGWMSMLTAALLAAMAMFLTGCLSLRRAGQSVELGTVVVMASAIGLEASITETGLSAVIADALTMVSGDSPFLALVVIYIGCVVMTNLITNSAAAAFMFPISFAIAEGLGVSFMPFTIALMLGCSYAFINPASYQTHLMVYEPGHYKFSDFAKVGIPITIIVGIVTIILSPLIFGFAVP
jgi:di/tricarboxylate transporter